MNLREGKIGILETISVICISVCVSELFTVNSQKAYSNGNSLYISIPISILISAIVFILSLEVKKKTGRNNLFEFLEYGLGSVIGRLFSGVIVAFILFGCALPFSELISTIYRFIFPESEYIFILLFVVPAVLYVAFKGFECIGRTAKVFSTLIIVSVVLSIILSAKNYNIYRLYPIVGDGALSVIGNSFKKITFALPSFIMISILFNSQQGIKSSRKSAIISMIISVIICFVVQICLGMLFTYKDLSEMIAPLYKEDMLQVQENYMLRLDKINLFIWLIACIVAVGFNIYGASYLYAQKYSMQDIRPVVIAMCALVTTLSMINYYNVDLIVSIRNIYEEYGYILIMLTIILPLLLCLLKYLRQERKSKVI